MIKSRYIKGWGVREDVPKKNTCSVELDFFTSADKIQVTKHLSQVVLSEILMLK